MADSLIVDRNGRGISSAALYNTLYRTPSQSRGDQRPRPSPRAKTYEAVSAWQRREMVDISRVIAAGVPNIDTALIQAGEFSIGDSWHIKSRSSNIAWGKKRDEWFNQFFMRDCNGRGRQFDWHSTLRQLNWTRKVEADYAIWFDGQPHKDPKTGREIDPTGKFNVVKYDRISTGLIGGWKSVGMVSVGNGLDQVKELPRTWNYYATVTAFGSWPGIYVINDPASPFDGQRIIDGVILDSNSITLGYRLIGFNQDGLPTYADVPKNLLHFNFSARRQVDLVRGIPELAESIIPNMNLDDIQYLISMAMKLASALAVTRESTDGNPSRAGRANLEEEITDSSGNPLTDQSGNPITRRRTVEEIFPGIIELATNNKEALKALDFNRPTMNEENFIARVETSCLHKLWPRSLIYAESTGRAGTRAVASQANTICTWDQKCTERDGRFIADRATEYSMRMGYIPMNDNLYDPYDYVFTVPGKFTVDEGNDSKMRLQSLGRCTISRGMICELDGYLAEEIEEQREAEIDRTLKAAERLAAKHKDFTVKEIALMLDSGDQNISFADNAQVPADGTGAEEELPPGAAGEAAPEKTPGEKDSKGAKKP